MSDAEATVSQPEPEPPFVHFKLADFERAMQGTLIKSQSEHKELWLRVPIKEWAAAAQIVKDMGCTYFSYLSGIDWQPNPNLNGEKQFVPNGLKEIPPVITETSIRYAGGNSRFQVIARVADLEAVYGVTLIADLDEDLSIPTWTKVFAGADWHEREAWEMFGFQFDGHPGLRHLYLPDEFAGHPLRKDYALAARIVRPWPGFVDMEEMPAIPEEPAEAGTNE